MSNPASWERRFRAPIISFPSWAADAPDRLVIASTESGSYQLHAWDRATGLRRQVTHDAVGVIRGRPTRDGTGVIWFRDDTGDETGSFVTVPFDEDVAPEPLIEGLPTGWTEGLAVGRTRSVAGISSADGFSVWTAGNGERARRIHHHEQPVQLAGGSGLTGSVDRGALSADDRLVCLEVMEDGDVLHPALRAIDASTGGTVAELRDPGLELAGFGFSPIPGDQRITITHERTGERRPALWNVTTGEVTELTLDLVGPIDPVGWWPDGSALLLQQLVGGRNRLHRYDLGTGTLETLDTQPGAITAAAVRPDGAVWYLVHAGEHSARLLAAGSPTPLLVPDGPPAPEGRPMQAWAFANPNGQQVHGFLVHPDGPGPHPVMMRVHGGPHSLDMDRWAPDVQAHVDAGFLVAMVNYRGSVGFGPAWRDELTGNVGFLELEDVLAGLDDILAKGLGDPERVVLAGWSWGGYVTLLGAGRHPERWAAAIGGVPVADYVAAYEDESPALQALDRALFGGSPAEAPAMFVERNPITYVDNVRAPLLILAGENDSRCPIRQVWNYVDRLRARGVEPYVYTYATGHASYDVEERVRQTAVVLDFLARTVPGIARPEGVDDLVTRAVAAAG